MNATLTLHESSAQQLALHLPLPGGVTARGNVPPGTADAYAGTGFTATFVGGVTADLALILTDRSFLAPAGGLASGLVSAVDVLRPAMEAAAAVFEAGVLGELREEDAGALLADPETAIFELAGGAAIAGWFAVRVREHNAVHTAAGNAARGQDSVLPARLGLISNVEMALTVEIGRTRMSVRDALALEPGKVIELDRSAGAPADVLLNGRLIAHGEVVVVDQDYAVRITRILDTAEGLG